jgi:RNA polymerase sigma factor (sigma-70 family)
LVVFGIYIPKRRIMITTEFVRKFEGLVKTIAHDYEKDPNKFEDLTQDIWLQVCRKAHLLPNDEKAHSTWLTIVSENVCKHHVKGTVQEPDVVLDSTLIPPEEDEESKPEGSWIEQTIPSQQTAEDDTLLLEFIARGATLSELESAVFNLAYWHGRSYDDIAKTLGIAKDSIGPIVGRLRGKLEVRDLYHSAHTYHAPGAVWGDWAWKPKGIGNLRMENNKNVTSIVSRSDRSGVQQAVSGQPYGREHHPAQLPVGG